MFWKASGQCGLRSVFAACNIHDIHDLVNVLQCLYSLPQPTDAQGGIMKEGTLLFHTALLEQKHVHVLN